jgi:hypothetical protein
LNLSQANDKHLIALNDALAALAHVELRYFGGLSVEDTAAVLGVSVETGTRDWRLARGWLRLQSEARMVPARRAWHQALSSERLRSGEGGGDGVRVKSFCIIGLRQYRGIGTDQNAHGSSDPPCREVGALRQRSSSTPNS